MVRLRTANSRGTRLGSEGMYIPKSTWRQWTMVFLVEGYLCNTGIYLCQWTPYRELECEAENLLLILRKLRSQSWYCQLYLFAPSNINKDLNSGMFHFPQSDMWRVNLWQYVMWRIQLWTQKLEQYIYRCYKLRLSYICYIHVWILDCYVILWATYQFSKYCWCNNLFSHPPSPKCNLCGCC